MAVTFRAVAGTQQALASVREWKGSRGGTSRFPEWGGASAEAGPPFVGLPWEGLEWARRLCPGDAGGAARASDTAEAESAPNRAAGHGRAPYAAAPQSSPGPQPPRQHPALLEWATSSCPPSETSHCTPHTACHARVNRHRRMPSRAHTRTHTRTHTQLAGADGSGCWHHAAPCPLPAAGA